MLSCGLSQRRLLEQGLLLNLPNFGDPLEFLLLGPEEQHLTSVVARKFNLHSKFGVGLLLRTNVVLEPRPQDWDEELGLKLVGEQGQKESTFTGSRQSSPQLVSTIAKGSFFEEIIPLFISFRKPFFSLTKNMSWNSGLNISSTLMLRDRTSVV